MPDETRPDQENPLSRMRRRLAPSEFPTDDRSRMRMVMDSLVLHLHPAKVPWYQALDPRVIILAVSLVALAGAMILAALRGLQHIHNHPE